MRFVAVHADHLSVNVKSQAIDDAEQLKWRERQWSDVLVVFIAFERGDSEELLPKAEAEIRAIMEKVGVNNVVLYPWVHLTSNPSSPILAKHLLLTLSERLHCEHAPFGWYKAFKISTKGHPLSELSREIKAGEEISQSLKQESTVKSEFYVFTPEGLLVDYKTFNYVNHPNLKHFVDYETKKSRVYEKEPVHISLMKAHELVAYEEGSDPGNFRYLPKGVIIKRVLEQLVNTMCIDYGAMEVETPIMYDYNHPALFKYLNRFPARQYIVLSDNKRLFLRFAACFGQFLAMHDMVLSYKHLPLKLYELTRYSFRREQRGELAGLKRLRAFTMPDMHTLCRDMDEAKKAFEEQLELSLKWIHLLGLDVEVAFRVERKFFEENKEWYERLVKKVGKPVLFELFDKRYAYFITKFEFNFIDSKNKAASLSTVQIDVENADTYDISFVDEDGQRKRPIILHASISGAIERNIFAILEREGMKAQGGEKPLYPLFLAPIQARVIPVNETVMQRAERSVQLLRSAGIRVDLDDREETLSKKIRQAEKEWIPYVLVVGEREGEGMVSVRDRETGETRVMDVEELVHSLKQRLQSLPNYPLTLPVRLSQRPKMGV